MYNILGLIFSKTDDKKEKIDMVGAKYVTKTQDADIAKEMDAQQDALEKLSASSEIPKAYTLAKGILLLLSIAFIIVYNFLSDYDWSMVLLIAGLIMVISIAVITYIGNRRKQKNDVKKEAEIRAMLPKINATYKKAKKAMGIPDGAKEMDVITQRYVPGKNGELIEKGLIVADFANLAQYVYVSEGNLVVAGLDKVFSIPSAYITEIRKVDKKYSVRGWNKKVSPKDDRYKQFGVKAGRYDVYSIAWHYEIVVDDGESGGVIKIMPYELSAIKKLIKLDCAE